jgi:hypothetical protein
MFESLYTFKLINGIPYAIHGDHKVLLHSENYKNFNSEIETAFLEFDKLPF